MCPNLGSNPCLEDNGNCTHICLLSSTYPEGYGCNCPDGLVLAGDGRTCSSMFSFVIIFCYLTVLTVTQQCVPLIPSYVIMPSVFPLSGSVIVLMTVVTIVMRITAMVSSRSSYSNLVCI